MLTFIEHSTTLWLLASCTIIIIELVLLNTYYLLALAIGTTSAAAAAWLDASTAIQWLACSLGSIAGFLGMKTLRPKPSNTQQHDDISHLVGKQVRVSETIDPRGRVIYKSVGWAAESDELLHSGERARIIRVHGSTLFVEKCDTKPKSPHSIKE